MVTPAHVKHFWRDFQSVSTLFIAIVPYKQHFRDSETGAVLELVSRRISNIYGQEKLDRKSVRSSKERMRLCLFKPIDRCYGRLFASKLWRDVHAFSDTYTCNFFCSVGSFAKYVFIFFSCVRSTQTYTEQARIFLGTTRAHVLQTNICIRHSRSSCKRHRIIPSAINLPRAP